MIKLCVLHPGEQFSSFGENHYVGHVGVAVSGSVLSVLIVVLSSNLNPLINTCPKVAPEHFLIPLLVDLQCSTTAVTTAVHPPLQRLIH